MNSRGVYSLGRCGFVVKINEDGESVTWYFDDGSDKEKKMHQSKIYFSKTGNPYFRARGVIIYLNEVIRIELPEPSVPQ